jgi:hypothetical protein
MNPYFQAPGQSSGNLSSAWNGGHFFPDAVLRKEELDSQGKFWRYPFEFGNALEALCEDVAKPGSHDIGLVPTRFLERFFVSEIKSLSFGESKGKRSKAEEIAWMIQAGKPLPEIKLRQDGSPNKTHAKTNDLIRECADHPGKIPMTQKDFGTLKGLAEKICEMPIPDRWWQVKTTASNNNPTFMSGKIGDFFRDCEWQRPIYWESDGIRKKALPDCLFAYKGTGAMIDIKYSATLPNWLRRLKSNYWIQDLHYREGVESLGLEPIPMLFVVGAAGDKSTPPMATCVTVANGECTRKNRCFCTGCRMDEYKKLSVKYDKWEKDGRAASGFLPARKEKVWV